MKRILALCLVALLALSGCGRNDEYTTVTGPNGQPQVVQQHHDSGSSWIPAILGGVAGYMLGRNSATASAPAPNYQAPAAAVAAAAAPSKPSWFSGLTGKKVAPSPVPSTAPKSYSLPAPTVASKPSYSGPTGYSSVTQAKPTYGSGFSKPSAPSYSTPSRSYSSPSYSSPSRSYSSPSYSRR